ncbi:hypothetical protein I302_100658 [Kwoniella bestiolae CBS 10118]|uniref:DH domain-containing protein n=1 Tax=Kwoniella bestiolae CBS 10118 TaxID=1296100 RepID=A0A1B9G5R5_9TREE|nr:hypothetical protein I302_04033 [Kwoniella bestiolae CBS 10118]OCF26350.1 hypothetical protein I302_04033 [Kwoniella bestiolae CBS 10118]
MPNSFSSPPLRQPRSPNSRSCSSLSFHSIDTPPLPQWDNPISPYTSMTRSSKHVLSPHRAAPPVPPLPSASPATSTMYGIPFPPASPSLHLTSSPIVRSASSSSSSSTASSSSTTSQRVSTPPPPVRTHRTSKSSSKLLPALPLSIATTPELHQSPYASPASSLRSKRVAVNYTSDGIGLGLGLTDEVQIVVSREGRRSRAVSVSYGSKSNTSLEDMACLPTPPITGSASSPTNERTPSRSSTRPTVTIPSPGGTPPRPARRATSAYPSPASASASNPRKSPLLAPRPISLTPQSQSDLVPPQTSFSRSISPSGDSISTITVSPASTPRPFFTEIPSKPTITTAPESSTALASALEEPASVTLGGRKRDSAQRRLSALRGLVANLDFNQPWSFSENTVSEENLFSPEPQYQERQDDNNTGSYDWTSGSGSDHLNFGSEPQSECSDESFIMSSSSEEVLASPVHSISHPMKYDPFESTKSVIQPEIAESHGWPEPRRQSQQSIRQICTSPSTATLNSPKIDFTPVRRDSGSRKQPNSTPPRRPRQFRSSSDLLSRTPEPPRPATRARKEVFEVASSGYSKSLEPVSPILPVTPTSTWRSSLPNDEIYTRLLENYGPMEIKRQEIIWEMCETEHTFIKSMRTVLRLFAIPLKTPQGKWIDGIPGKITDLFDCLECIAHAHGVISATERDMRRRSDILDVGNFVSTFKNWVQRLEVHEWYLIRFESVVSLVEENVRDPDSVFGEFVRMQMKEEVLGSMSLGSMLLKPVQRLTKYPLFLKRLLDATPHPHPVHPEILSLLSTTESIILNLQATKAREEDFEQLQALESRLVGLPEDFTLAIRGRKLLGQGQVIRVPPSKDLSSALGARARAGSMHSSRGSISSSVSSSAPSVSPWDFSASLTPSRTSAFSVSSNGSSFYSGPPSRSNSITKHSSPSPSRPGINRSPSSTSSFMDVNSYYSTSRPSTPSIKTHKKKEEVLAILVFDDLVILGQSVQEKSGLFGVGGNKRNKGVSTLRVLGEGEGGVGKVGEVRDWSGWNGYSNLFSLTLMPIAHSARHPLSPITTAFTIPSHLSMGSLSTSPSLRSLKSSSSSSSSSTPSNSGGMSNLTCPVLNNMSSLLGMLGQVSTSGMSGRGSEYVIEEKEVLEEGEVEVHEVYREMEGEWQMGYAA